MFNALCNLAEREQLLGDPAFEMKRIGWIINLSDSGKFLGFIPTHETPPAKKNSKATPKPVAKQFLIPRQFNPKTGGTRTAGDYAYFLVDKLDYALGLQEGSEVGNPPEGKPLNRLTLFRNKIEIAAKATSEPALASIVIFLDKVLSQGLDQTLPAPLKANELIAFKVESTAPVLAHDLETVKTWWLDHLQSEGESDAISDLHCLISGKSISSSGLFPKLKRVPGGQSAGAGLVSFNAPAFESYNLKGSENAPISSESAQKVATALNRLLDPTFRRQDGELMPIRNKRLTATSALCYWSEQGAFEDEFGAAMELGEPALEDDSYQVGEQIESFWKGRLASQIENTDIFHAVTLSGAQGRVIVRDYFRSSVADLARAMLLHYEAFELVPKTRPGKGKTLPPLAPFSALLECVVLGGKKDRIPETLAPALLRSILLTGTEAGLPLTLVTRALERDRVEIRDDTWLDSLRRDRRATILKAFLIRNHKHNISPEMQPTETNPHYICGRLFAAYGEMQRLSQLPRKINSTLTDKYYGQATASPMRIMGKLDPLYEAHKKKAIKNRDQPWISGKAVNLARSIEKMYSALRTDSFSESSQPVETPSKVLPTKTTLEQQALFVIGYQHQSYFQSLSVEQQSIFLENQNFDSDNENVLVHLSKKAKQSTASS